MFPLSNIKLKSVLNFINTINHDLVINLHDEIEAISYTNLIRDENENTFRLIDFLTNNESSYENDFSVVKQSLEEELKGYKSKTNEIVAVFIWINSSDREIALLSKIENLIQQSKGMILDLNKISNNCTKIVIEFS